MRLGGMLANPIHPLVSILGAIGRAHGVFYIESRALGLGVPYRE